LLILHLSPVVEVKLAEFSQKWLSLLVNGAIGLVALAGVVAMQGSDRLGGLPSAQVREGVAPAASAAELKQAVQQEALRLQLLKSLPTFGFNNLIADWTFIQFLQYFGDDEARNVTGYGLSSKYFDVITKLDPRRVEIYPFLAVSVSFYQAKPETTVQLMERGTNALSSQIHPDAWQVWRHKGLDELLLLGDAAESARSHEMAADWVEETPKGQELAQAFRATAQFLRRDPDSVPVRFAAWSSVYYQTNDKLVRLRAKEALLRLGAQVQKDKNGQERFVLPPRSN
jgi:hypothetical protein